MIIMTKQIIKSLYIACVVLVIALLQSCSSASSKSPGHEYMPDMAHAVSVEANVYNHYAYNTFEKESVIGKKATSMPRLPVMGSVPRGYAGYANEITDANRSKEELLASGAFNQNSIRTPMNGSVPYYYTDNEDERTRATKEIIKNPFPITAKRLEKGKELYVIFCGICHGEKANGGGYLVRDDGGKYPAQPANLVSDDLINSSEGRYYHSIIYGKNTMGGYSDKLSYEERWSVVHYIRSLQAGTKSLVYSEVENTLNKWAIPGASVKKATDHAMETKATHTTNSSH